MRDNSQPHQEDMMSKTQSPFPKHEIIARRNRYTFFGGHDRLVIVCRCGAVGVQNRDASASDCPVSIRDQDTAGYISQPGLLIVR